MKRKLDDSIDNDREVIKRGCYFQCITSVLFRRDNRLNAFEKLNRITKNESNKSMPKPLESICSNCQQLKKDKQKVSNGLMCYFCDKFVCFNCAIKCSICENDFCNFCSVHLYDDQDRSKCLSC